MATKKLKGEVDKEQIAQWKKEHGGVIGIVVDDTIVYFKNPTRKILEAASKLGQASPLKFNESSVNNCKIGGDLAALEKEDFYMAVQAKVADLVVIKEAEVINF